MSKPLIVIADMDTAYLAELENKFLVELGDRAELEIISDPEYFEQFFSIPMRCKDRIFRICLFYQNIRNRAEPKNYRYQEFISIMASKSYTMN